VRHQLWALDPTTYDRHPLHRGDCAWPESNCYVDLWVELLHTIGAEPLAALPFTLGIDLEGDQWTFFKFPLADLYTLYGVDVFELNVWRPLVAHVEEQVALGRPVIVEADAFYLPDTAGTSYRSAHVKTSIGIQALDREASRLGYFHNAGYYELEGADFAGLFRLEEDSSLPPYVEVAKVRRRPALTGGALVGASIELLSLHLDRRPDRNPFRRYAVRFRADLETLAAAPLSYFHEYAFATFRQYGPAFEFAAAYLEWLEAGGESGLTRSAAACRAIATGAKTLQLRTARRVSAGRRFDPAPTIDAMADAWDEAMAGLIARYGAGRARGTCLASQE
jgi:hypothetical protein